MMAVGAEGVISVAGNIIPRDIIDMVNAALSGDYGQARALHHRMFPLFRDMLGPVNKSDSSEDCDASAWTRRR